MTTAAGPWRLAIDYGSSHTAATLLRPGGGSRPLIFDGTPLLPSAVYADTDGALLTGADAIGAARVDPARFEPSPKRQIDTADVLLGDRPVAVVALIAATLRRVADEAARVNGGQPFETVLTHPVGWGPTRRATLLTATRAAGLTQPHLLPEPVAAATHLLSSAGAASTQGRPLAVFDLGGGTFDVAVVRATGHGVEILAGDGLPDFGGADLDAVVVDLVRDAVARVDPAGWARLTTPATLADRRHFRALWDAARVAKESLSRRAATTIAIPLLDRDVPVTREQFESAAAPALHLTVGRTLAVLHRSHVDPGAADVLLVGGASRTPLVATLLHRATGRPPIVLEQPELIVAEGAVGYRLRSAPPEHPPGVPAEPPPAEPPPAQPPPAAPMAPPVAAGPRGDAAPLRSHGSRTGRLAEAAFFGTAPVIGLWYATAHSALLSGLSTGESIVGIGLAVCMFVVALGALARAASPDLLIVNDRGIHLQRIRFGRGVQRETLLWEQVREAFVTVVDLVPHLVVRTHLGPHDGAVLTGRKYRTDVGGYVLCELRAVGVTPDRLGAALTAHAPPAH